MAGLPMQMTQMNPIGQSPKSLLCLSSLSKGGGVQHHLTGGKLLQEYIVDSWAGAEQ